MSKRQNIDDIGVGSDELPKPDYRKVNRPKIRELKTKKRFTMNKAINWIKDTLAGENKVGELVHGLADLLPIPNQAIAKAVKALLSGDLNEAKAELPNIFTTRNIVALVASVAYLLGWVTLEDIKNLVNALGGVL